MKPCCFRVISVVCSWPFSKQYFFQGNLSRLSSAETQVLESQPLFNSKSTAPKGNQVYLIMAFRGKHVKLWGVPSNYDDISCISNFRSHLRKSIKIYWLIRVPSKKNGRPTHYDCRFWKGKVISPSRMSTFCEDEMAVSPTPMGFSYQIIPLYTYQEPPSWKEVV